MSAPWELTMQYLLLKIKHGVFQCLKDISLTWLLQQALRIIFANEAITVLKALLKEKQ
jgi:hypothetical protein